MPATKIKSNKSTGLWLGPRSAVPDILRPTLAQLLTLINVSEATKWDGYDFGPEASEQDEDRALTDSASAASRGYEQYGGSISFYNPLPSDTSSIYRVTRNLVLAPHTELVLVQRDGYSVDTPWDEGQVFNIFHVITDANSEQRGDKKRFYTIDFKNKGYAGINRIVPSATPSAVAITPATPVVEAGESIQLRAAYEGVDITVGAEWSIDDETIAIVTPHGKLIGVAEGEALVSAAFPGGVTGTVAIDVTAP